MIVSPLWEGGMTVVVYASGFAEIALGLDRRGIRGDHSPTSGCCVETFLQVAVYPILVGT